MFALLRSPRWQAFTAAALVAIIAFGLLSLWQYHRAEEKRLEFAAVAARMAAAPITPDPTDTDPELEWRNVTVTGTYDADTQLLVRNRPNDGKNGFWIVTLLRNDTVGTWVVRGWMPADSTAGTEVTAPAPPPGEVTVSGYARLPDPDPVRRGDDLPTGQITAMNTAQMSALTGVDTASAWYVISAFTGDVVPVALPEPTDSRNLSYAGQWLLFAAIAVGGWYYFLRREWAEQNEPAPSPEPVEV